MERYIRIVLDTGYCGNCGTREEYCIKTDKSDRELDFDIIELAFNHADPYTDTICVSAEEYAEEPEQEMEAFFEEVLAASYWEEITKEEYENGDWE